MEDNKNNLNFDDEPLKSGGNNFLDLLEKKLAVEKQEESQAQTDLNLPLNERVKNKNWKVRKSALEEISKKINEESEFDSDLFKLLPQILLDQHQGNLEEAVGIVSIFLDKEYQIPKENQQDLNNLIKNLIEKCYTCSKITLKDKSKEVILNAVEYLNSADILIENIVTLLQSKNQKLNQAGVSISILLLISFGSGAVNYKRLAASLATLSDKCAPLIKQQIVEFFIELYKWIRKGIKPLIEKKVKGNVKNDIDKGIEQINEQLGLTYVPKPVKFLGKISNNMDLQGNNMNKNNNNSLDDDIVMSDLSEVDIFTKKLGFDDKFIERMKKPDCKWKEKKKAFDELTEITDQKKIKKIKNTNRTNFNDMVKKLLKEPNINVIHSIINAISNLSLGLENNYIEGRDFFPRLMDFFKEKKDNFINSLIICLLNLSNNIDDNILNEMLIKYGTKSNLCNPAKVHLCLFFEKLLDKKINNAQLNEYIPFISEIIIKFMDDASPDIRTAAVKIMVNIKCKKMSLYNNNSIKSLINEQKNKKIEDFMKNNNVSIGNCMNINKKQKKNNISDNSCSGMESLNSSQNNTNNSGNSVIKSEFDIKPIKTKKIGKRTLYNQQSKGLAPIEENPNNNLNVSTISENCNNNNTNVICDKRLNKKSMIKSKSRNNKCRITSSVSADNVLNISEDIDLSNKEDIITFIQQYIDKNILKHFDSQKWNERKEGFSNLISYFSNENNLDNLNDNYEYYLKFILIKNKSFKENNVIILKESIICIENLVEKVPFLAKKYSNNLIKLFIDKLGDRKIVGELSNLILKLIENSSPKEILIPLIKYLRNKSVVILKEGANIINTCLETSNNHQYFPIKEIVEYCCSLEANSNSQCRNAATVVLCTLYKLMGNAIKVLLKDIKDTTLKAIEIEFKKITPPQSTGEGNTKLGSIILDQMFPRVDISKKITSALIKDLNEGKWTSKKESFAQIESIIISANKKIQSKGLNDLFSSLKNNLKDSNKNIVRLTLKLICELSDALGNGFKSYQKQVLPGIISNLADKNKQVMNDTLNCIEKLISIVGFDSIAAYFPNHLNVENFESRNELLKLLVKHKNFVANKKEYIKDYFHPLINCLLDKNLNIRNMTEEIVQEILKYYPIQLFLDVIKNLKPAIANQVRSILTKYNNTNVGNEIYQNNNMNIGMSINNKKKQKFEEEINNGNNQIDEAIDDFSDKDIEMEEFKEKFKIPINNNNNNIMEPNINNENKMNYYYNNNMGNNNFNEFNKDLFINLNKINKLNYLNNYNTMNNISIDQQSFISGNTMVNFINSLPQKNNNLNNNTNNFINNYINNNQYNQQNNNNNFIDNNNTNRNNNIMINNNLNNLMITENNTINKNNIDNNQNFALSKSPVVDENYKKIFKDNNNLNSQKSILSDILPMNQNELPVLLKKIYLNDLDGKCLALFEIKKILINSIKNNNKSSTSNQEILNQKQIKEIIISFNTLLSNITNNIKTKKNDNTLSNDNIEDNPDIKLLRYLLEVYFSISNHHELMKLITDESTLYECYERLFILITEKSLILCKWGSEIIKIINSIIIGLLTNCNVTLSIVSLIKIILNYKSNLDDCGQVCTLSIKCLDKFKNLIFKLENQKIINTKRIFLAFYEFFSEFEKTNENLKPHNINEENALSIINMIINEYIKIYKNKIWDLYHESLNNDMIKSDIHLKRIIQIISKDNSSTNYLMNLEQIPKVNQDEIKINNNNNINIENKFEKDNNLPYPKPSFGLYTKNPSIFKSKKINISFVGFDKSQSQSQIRNPKEININKNIINNNDNELTMLMPWINKLKENGKQMNDKEKNDCYYEIVSLLRINNKKVTVLSSKLNEDDFGQILEIYNGLINKDRLSSESQSQEINQKINEIQNQAKSISIINKNISTNNINDNNNKDNKINDNNNLNEVLAYSQKKIKSEFSITEQAKRIQEYKNKFNSLTEKTGTTNKNVNLFVGDENKPLNSANYNNDNGDLNCLEMRKRIIDSLHQENILSMKSNIKSTSETLNDLKFNYPFLNNINNTGDLNKKNNFKLSSSQVIKPEEQNDFRNKMKLKLNGIRQKIQKEQEDS